MQALSLVPSHKHSLSQNVALHGVDDVGAQSIRLHVQLDVQCVDLKGVVVIFTARSRSNVAWIVVRIERLN